MKFNDILANLRKKVYQPVYFLMGDETYFIDEICDYIANNVLDEYEKEFNQTVLYGKDTDVATIISEAKRFGDVDIAYSSRQDHCDHVPSQAQLPTASGDSLYFHYTSNNTIAGTQFHYIPEHQDGFLVCEYDHG